MYNFKEKIVLGIATVAGAGYLKFPGTFGSFVAVLLWAACAALKITEPFYLCLILFLIVLGTIVATASEKILKKVDPGEVVIDEVVGILITFYSVPFSLKYAVIGFILFRLYDILKPFPINVIQKFPKGYGIMLDDILAGFCSFIILKVLCLII